jgi:fumarate reductase flavoprotein subunit
MKADVIVVAGGASGLAAAITAAEKGAKVIIFEKAGKTGGCANLAVGLLGIETRRQRERLVGLTKEEAFTRFMDYTHWRSDARLVKAYLNKSAETIAWLEELGVNFVEPSKYFPGSEATWHIIMPKNGKPGLGGASTMIQLMTDRALGLGVEICLKTPVKKLIKENGRVVGVLAKDSEGKSIEARSGAVIVATGGFGDNPQFIKEHTGYEWGKDLFSYRSPGLTGDGIKMAWEAGAGKDKMGMELVYFAPNTGGYAPIELPFRQPNLVVNLQGERFINEEVMENPVFSVNAIARQKNRLAFSIIDEKIINYYDENGLDLINVVTANIGMDQFHQEKTKAIAGGDDNLTVTDSIGELAAKTGIDADNLKKTIEEYNQACATRDTLFNKNFKYLKPIVGPRFYALRFAPSAYGSLGGIKVNYKMEAVTEKQEVIPGLYAAGTDANSIYDADYVFILPGNSLGFAVNSGRIAGENAVSGMQK